MLLTIDGFAVLVKSSSKPHRVRHMPPPELRTRNEPTHGSITQTITHLESKDLIVRLRILWTQPAPQNLYRDLLACFRVHQVPQ